jgi:hypothetical protein
MPCAYFDGCRRFAVLDGISCFDDCERLMEGKILNKNNNYMWTLSDKYVAFISKSFNLFNLGTLRIQIQILKINSKQI